MSISEVVVEGRLHRLDHRIGRGGEGVVYSLENDNRLAVKLYNPTEAAGKQAKIAAMVQAQIAGRAPLVAFPLFQAFSRSGAFVGFVMKLVTDHKPLHELYSPGPRKQHFPQADYRFLVRTAANLARAVASVHLSNCVIGDINHSGILVSPKAIVALIDADSFQFVGAGENFLCRVGVPEYTPPELQGKSLAQVVRTPNHDAFGLAVVIFQLLFMGRHPFVGSVRTGEIPPLHENIRNFRYVYADNRNVGMDQPPGTPSVSDFSPELASLFNAAFSSASAGNRPSAERWVAALESLERNLAQCQDNPLHFGPRDASECAWCEMEKLFRTVLFLPYAPSGVRPGVYDPGSVGFNLEQIWRQIEPLLNTIPAEPQPKINGPAPSPSASALTASKAKSDNKPLGIIVLVAVVAAFVFIPALWFIWILLGFWGYGLVTEEKPVDAEEFKKNFIEAETRWNNEVVRWAERIGYRELHDLKTELINSRDTYRNLMASELSLKQKYQTERRERQLYAYLDKYEIQNASISGIGPAKTLLLASYGIDSAADVNRARLLAVPGFGEITSQKLLEWRARLEQRFVYNARETDSDRIEATKIRSMIETKAAPLRRQLHAGPQNLKAALNRYQHLVASSDPIILRTYSDREQAICDLRYLGAGIPSVPAARRPSTAVQHPNLGTGYRSPNAPGAGANPNCPRCGSPMVLRLAKRGRNAGGHFWGCSRYPNCKGTKSV